MLSNSDGKGKMKMTTSLMYCMARTIEREYTSRTAHRTLHVETTKQTDYGKEGYKYRSKGRNNSYN